MKDYFKSAWNVGCLFFFCVAAIVCSMVISTSITDTILDATPQLTQGEQTTILLRFLESERADRDKAIKAAIHFQRENQALQALINTMFRQVPTEADKQDTCPDEPPVFKEIGYPRRCTRCYTRPPVHHPDYVPGKYSWQRYGRSS